MKPLSYALPDDACPCCGQPWPAGRSKKDARRILYPLLGEFGPQRARLLGVLLDNFNQYYPRDKLIDLLWGDRYDGGPDDPTNTIAVHCSLLRKTIIPLGFNIDRAGRYGARLSWLSASDSRFAVPNNLTGRAHPQPDIVPIKT